MGIFAIIATVIFLVRGTNSILQVPALGRSYDLLHFYNVHEDKFFPISALTDHIPKRTKIPKLKGNLECTSKIVKTLDDRLNSIGLSLKSKVDVMMGAADFSGSISYAKQTRFESDTVYGVVHYRRLTMYETFHARLPELQALVSMYPATVLDGTHVVIGITSGVDLAISFEFRTNKNSGDSNAEFELETSLNHLSYSIGVGIKGQNRTSSFAASSETEIKVYGDLPLSTIPRTLEDVEVLLNSIPEIMEKTGEKGSPQYYDLIEVEKLQRIINHDYLMRDIRRSEPAKEYERNPEVVAFETQLLSVLEVAENTEKYVSMWKSRIQSIEGIYERNFIQKLTGLHSKFQSTYEIYLAKFKTNIKSCRNNVTREAKKEFLSVKRQYLKHKYGPKQVQKLFDTMSTVAMAKYYDWQSFKKNGVVFASRHLTVNQIRLQSPNKTIIFMYFTQKWKSESVDAWNRLTNWLIVQKGIRYVIDCDLKLHAENSCTDILGLNALHVEKYDGIGNKTVLLPIGVEEMSKTLKYV